MEAEAREKEEKLENVKKGKGQGVKVGLTGAAMGTEGKTLAKRSMNTLDSQLIAPPAGNMKN